MLRLKLSSFDVATIGEHERRAIIGSCKMASCKIHMVEEGTLDGSPKGGGKEELGEGE